MEPKGQAYLGCSEAEMEGAWFLGGLGLVFLKEGMLPFAIRACYYD